MAPLSRRKILISLFNLIFIYTTTKSQLNQYTTSIDPDGTHIWQSTSDFIPQFSTYHGRIPIGTIMSMEFDFTWWGYTNKPTAGAFETFFRIGCSAYVSQDPDSDPICSGGKGCSGHGLRYPSLWITGTNNGNRYLHVSVSNGGTCQPGYTLTGYGNIDVSTSYHMLISYNTTLLIVKVKDNDDPLATEYTQTWVRTPLSSIYTGASVPVWWMSNKLNETNKPSDFNLGNGTFSNIILKSWWPTPEPTAVPTDGPTTAQPSSTPSISPSSQPSTTPSANPTANPSISPTDVPSENPSQSPSDVPSTSPSDVPSTAPTTASPVVTTAQPTSGAPSETPSTDPTSASPTNIPSENPTTSSPSAVPSRSPTVPGQTLTPSMSPTTQV